MDYWVGFYKNEELVVSYIVEECVSEVVALSQALLNLKNEKGIKEWVTGPTNRVVVSQNFE